jgi:hypothetical protein
MSIFGRLAVKIAFAVASIFVVVWGALHFRLVGANLRVSWNYDYSPEPACSASRSTDCIDHFEVLDITTQPQSIARLANPASAFGRVNNISVEFKYGPPFGQRTISVVAVGKDSRGDPVTSNPYAARASVLIRPGATVSTILK